MRHHQINYQQRRPKGRAVARSARSPGNASARYAVNLRLLLWSVAIVVLAAPSLLAVRAVQVRRNAGVLFERAEELERQGDLTGAARTLFRYLQFHPDDGPARVFMATVFDKTAVTFAAKQRATEHYYRALVYFDERRDLRSRLAELLLELERPADAERECLRVLFGANVPSRAEIIAGVRAYQDELQRARLLSSIPEARSALRTLADACFINASLGGSWSPAEQLQMVKSALAVNPDSIDLVLLQAKVYRERLVEQPLDERRRLADELVTTVLENHPNVSSASLAMYHYRLEHGLPNADAALASALEAGPADYDVLIAAGSRAADQERFEASETHLSRAIEISPADPLAYAKLAQLLLKQGKTDEGISICRKGLKRCGHDEMMLSLVLLQGLIEDKDFAESQTRLDIVKQKQESIGPMLRLAERLQLRDAIATLEAELAIAEGKLSQAVSILRQATLVRSGEQRYADDIEARRQRWRRLAQVYELLHYTELAAKAFEESATLRDDSYQDWIAAGQAWQTAGRYESAVESFRAALKATDAQPSGWVLLARAEIEQQLRAAHQNWAHADHALGEARKRLGSAPNVLMLQVELLRAKGNPSAAIELLDKAVEAAPDETLPFAVLFYQTLGQDQRANQALDRLKTTRNAHDRLVRSLEAELCRRKKDYDQCKAILHDLVVRTEGNRAEKYGLRRQLVRVALEQNAAEGQKQLLALATDYPESSWALDRLADMALSRHDYTELAKYESALKDAEGEDGSIWRFYRAMRLVNQAADAQDSAFAEAIRLHGELQALRPLWPSTLQLKGRIAQRQGRVQDAAEAYQAAIEAGADSVTVFEGLVALLYANNRWMEADAFLSRLQRVGYQSPLLESYSSRLLLQQGDFQEAIASAQSGVKLRPSDPLAHIWLGQTLLLASNRPQNRESQLEMVEAAKGAFEQAIAVAPHDFRTWSGLLWYCARIGDKPGAARAIEGLRTKPVLSEPQRALALAQAHQLLGEFPNAEEHYLRAVKLLPRDAATQERLAQFYASYAPEKAEAAYRRLLDLSPSSQTARRALATLLATQGGDVEFNEAIRLLRDDKDQSTGRRLQALLLMRRGGKDDLAEARRLLEAVMRQSVMANANDRHLFALAAEADGDLAVARREFERLAADSGSAGYLAALIEFYLRHGQPEEAAGFVSRLTELEAESFRTTHIRARWMRAAGRPVDQIQREIANYHARALQSAGDDAQRLAIVTQVAGLFTQLELPAAAERCFRQHLTSHSSAHSRQAFALWLVENERFDDAVGFAMEDVAGDWPEAEAIQLLSNVLAIAAAHGKEFAEAELRVEALVQARSEDANLLFELGTMKHMQGESDAARQLYEKCIRLAPYNAFVRNNLSMLLLEQPGASRDCLRHIEEALRIAGPMPELRDTYALVLAQQGRPEEGCRILKTLLSQFPRNARYLFHLAIANQKAALPAAARDALQKATANHLDAETMTPEELRLLTNLRATLGEKATAAELSRFAHESPAGDK